MKKNTAALCALLAAMQLFSCAQYETKNNTDNALYRPGAEFDNTDTSDQSVDQTADDTQASPDKPTDTDKYDAEQKHGSDETSGSNSDTVKPDTPTKPETPSKAGEAARISFVAAGDNVIHKCIWRDAERRAAWSGYHRDFDFKPTYEYTTDYVKSFDLAFINQETLLGGVELGLQSYPTFNSPIEVGLDLKEMGYDIVNIAHNHMADQGIKGLQNTIDFFKSDAMNGVTMIGGYENAEDFDTIRTVEREGVKIALLSYTYGTNEGLPAGTELIVPKYRSDDIIRQCALAEEAGDITVVSVHWGHENTTKPTDEQRRVAKLLAENGADVIIGHHPHVLQPIEWIETDRGRTLCIYSLGNLISGMAEWENMVGGFASFDIVMLDDGTVTVENVEFVATVCYFESNHLGSKLYYLGDYTEELAKSHGTIANYGEEYASPERIEIFAQDIMGDYLKLKP